MGIDLWGQGKGGPMSTRKAGNEDISWFVDLHDEDKLNLSPPYQRNSVWTRKDKEFFLETIFLNMPCPAIFLHKETNEHGKSIYNVVDGKQRLKTIIDFVKGELTYPKSSDNLMLKGKTWEEIKKLPDERQKFWDYSIPVQQLNSVEPSFLKDVFDRLNRNSRNLSRQELRHAKFDGWFAKLIDSEQSDNFWEDVGIVTPANSKRMRDMQFISELIILLIDNRIIGFDQDKLDASYARLDEFNTPEYEDALDAKYALLDEPDQNDAFFSESDIRTKLKDIKKIISKLLDKDLEIKKITGILSHFHTLWSLLAINDYYKTFSSIDEFAEKYLQFIKDVADINKEIDSSNIYASEYLKNFRGAATDKNQRLHRYEAIKNFYENT